MTTFKKGDTILTRGLKGIVLTGKVVEIEQRLIGEEYEDVLKVKLEDSTTITLSEHNLTNVQLLTD
jgi:cell shape-determining protein MreC